MQINRTGYLLIALFGIGGVIFCVLAVVTGLYWELGLIGVMWVFGTFIAIWIAIRQRRKLNRDIELWKTGLKGKATIVEGRSGAMINNEPLVALTVDLDFPGHEPRRYTKRMVINKFAINNMKPGMALPAYMDPAKPDDVLIVW